MERLLTPEEILNVNTDFKTNPIYRIYNLRKWYREDFPITEILSVSEKSDLIMIKGNSDTGFDHISERHNFFSLKIYTKEKEINNVMEKKFADLPSKFPPNLAPKDFVKIADEIFSPNNEIKDNENPGSKYFDLYIATVNFPNIEKPEPVKLLIYKNTKIIHTMYPSRDTFSRKIKILKNFPFRRDVVFLKYFNNDTLLQINIPYVDVNGYLWYSIHIEKNFITNFEKWSILTFHGHNVSKYKIDIIEQQLVKFNLYRSTYQHGDLRKIEKHIMEIDNQFRNGQLT